MPELAPEQELTSLPVIDYLPGTLFEYQFRANGDLEFVDVTGRWRRVRGCSADPDLGVHVFEEDLNELDHITGMLVDALPQDTTLEQLYLTNQRFKYLVDQCLEANHISPRWFSPRMLSWMLFDRVEGGYQVRAALRVLNVIPEGKYSTGQGNRIEGVHEYMALIATYSGGDIGKAHALAKVVAARDLMPELDALGYFSLDSKSKHERDVALWAQRQRASRNGHQASPEVSPEAGASSAVSFQTLQDIPKPRARAIVPPTADQVASQAGDQPPSTEAPVSNDASNEGEEASDG